MRILKDRDLYLMRNLKRGYSRKELGMTYSDELLLKVKDFLKNIE